MEFGAYLPVYGPAATRDTLLGFARRLEDLGCAGIRGSRAPGPRRGGR